MSENSDNKTPTSETNGKSNGLNANKAEKAKKGWSNPALRMIGIPRIKLPSRKWMIFWTVLAGMGGCMAYDRYEQKQIRKKWMKRVDYLGEKSYTHDKLPRKLTVFVAPPPGGYLEESLKYFKRYVKPVLNAGAVDFEVFTESKQGEIRVAVAEKIRELRKTALEDKAKAAEEFAKKAYEESWSKFFKQDVPGIFRWKWSQEESEDVEATKSTQELCTPVDVLGLYRITAPVDCKREDELNPDEAGGVICIGRGAYKEYLNGVHEGLLGPLESPVKAEEDQKHSDSKIVEIDAKTSQEARESTDIVQSQSKTEDSQESSEQKVAADQDQEFIIDEPKVSSEDQEKSGPEQDQEPPKVNKEELEEDKVEKAYISPVEYPNATFAPELDQSAVIKNAKNIPVLFEQPVFVFALPKVSGFLNTHRKIYNFFTRRWVADEAGLHTVAVVENATRQFVFKDLLMARQEEVDWPKKWVKKGLEKQSEWVQELVVDEKVYSRMKVFDVSRIKPPSEPSSQEPKQTKADLNQD